MTGGTESKVEKIYGYSWAGSLRVNELQGNPSIWFCGEDERKEILAAMAKDGTTDQYTWFEVAPISTEPKPLRCTACGGELYISTDIDYGAPYVSGIECSACRKEWESNGAVKA